MDESTKPLKVIDENEEAVTTVIEKPFSIIEKNSTAPSENLKIVRLFFSIHIYIFIYACNFFAGQRFFLRSLFVALSVYLL